MRTRRTSHRARLPSGAGDGPARAETVTDGRENEIVIEMTGPVRGARRGRARPGADGARRSGRQRVVLVEDVPPRPTRELLGLYEGIPLTERGGDYTMTLPDTITVFRNRTLRDLRQRGGRRRRGADHRAPRDRPPLRHRRRAAARARLRLRLPQQEPQRRRQQRRDQGHHDVEVPRRGPASWVCTANAEYVVSAPQNPTPRNAGVSPRAPVRRRGRAGTTPASSPGSCRGQPAVDQVPGDVPQCAPAAAPSATSNQVTRRPPRGRTRRGRPPC